MDTFQAAPIYNNFDWANLGREIISRLHPEIESIERLPTGNLSLWAKRYDDEEEGETDWDDEEDEDDEDYEDEDDEEDYEDEEDEDEDEDYDEYDDDEDDWDEPDIDGDEDEDY